MRMLLDKLRNGNDEEGEDSIPIIVGIYVLILIIVLAILGVGFTSIIWIAMRAATLS